MSQRLPPVGVYTAGGLAFTKRSLWGVAAGDIAEKPFTLTRLSQRTGITGLIKRGRENPPYVTSYQLTKLALSKSFSEKRQLHKTEVYSNGISCVFFAEYLSYPLACLYLPQAQGACNLPGA